MSKLKVSGNASGTGVITLEAPNTNTDRAITLPDSAGELINIAPSTSGNVLTSDGTDWTSAAGGADTSLSNLSAAGENKVCQAWVFFDGELTAASMIKSSFNVSSITDNGTGDYTINFSTALSNTNYCAVAHGEKVGGTNPNGSSLSGRFSTFRTTTTYRIGNIANTTHGFNDAQISVAIFEN